MWVFTKYGFYSAVCARQGTGRYNEPVDPDRVMIRARVREHLTALKEKFPEYLGNCDIQESTSTDYRYRVFVPKSSWAAMLAVLAEETDYDNFKSAVARQQGSAGAAYTHGLHDVWQVMLNLQRD